MHSPTLLLSLLPLIPTLLAFPLPSTSTTTTSRSPSALSPRSACTTIYPAYARLSSTQPTTPYLPSFLVSQSARATTQEQMALEFFSPAGANTCTLETSFPANFPLNAWGRQDLYVYSTDGHLTYDADEYTNTTWNSAPKAVSQVGTVKLESGARKVVNSFKCEEVMTYRVAVGRDWTEDGGVRWEFPGEGEEWGYGFRMTYGC